MTLRHSSILVALSILALSPLSTEAAPDSSVTLTEAPDRLRIEINGELFSEYIFKGEERFFPLFYPVMGPGQVPMTRRFPLEIVEGEDTDHPHHQSLWFAHSYINGHTFWGIKPNRDRIPGKTVHQGFTKIESGAKEATFVAENKYIAADGDVVMSDTRTVRIIAPEKPNDPRILDITIAFHASNGDVTFGDDKDGGMAIRVAPELQVENRSGAKNSLVQANGHLLNSEGITDKDTWGKRARWVDSYGSVNEKPVGVAIFDHPSNPRYPTYWHSRSYGLVTANIFGVHHFENLEDATAGEFVIPNGKTETFRWRFVFHEGDPKSANVESLFEAFAAE